MENVVFCGEMLIATMSEVDRNKVYFSNGGYSSAPCAKWADNKNTICGMVFKYNKNEDCYNIEETSSCSIENAYEVIMVLLKKMEFMNNSVTIMVENKELADMILSNQKVLKLKTCYCSC